MLIAAEAAAASHGDRSAATGRDSAMTITGDIRTLHLGGEGGRDGGSGGGGAALGPGAFGGPGGAVGRIVTEGRSGEFPGGGGGGGGDMDPAAIAWTSEELQAGAVGDGGVHGFDGQAGGQTSFGDPESGVFVVARGGEPGLSGRGQRLRSDKIAVSALQVGEYFSVTNGLAQSVNAGWAWMTALNLPMPWSLPLLLVLEAGDVPAGDYTISVRVVGPRKETAGSVSFPLAVSRPGPIVRVPVPIALPVVWTSYGLWTVIVSSEIGELARHPLVVKRVDA